FYFEPMRQQFGWSRTLMSGAYALSRAESGFLGPFGGYLVQRYGSRIVMAIGFMILALGFVLLSQTRSVASFYVAFLVLSVGSGLAAWTPVVPAITNWFRRKRSKALAFMMLGMGLGGVAVAPSVSIFINAFDWEKTALGSAILVAVIGLPLSRVMRYSPEPYGYLPDGDPPPTEKSEDGSVSPHAAGNSARSSTRPEVDFTVKEALKTPAFWLMSIGHALSLLVISTLGLHLVPFLETDLNFSAASAAQVVIVISGATMVAQPVGGFLGDRFPKQYIAAGTMIGHATALFLLATADSFSQVVLASALQGMAWGVRGPILTAMRGDYFGRRSFPMIQGFSHLVTMVGQISGPLFIGFMADNYSYSAGFKLIAIVTAVGVFLFLFLRSPQPPIRSASTLGVPR
ncbi:MAG: MFS transporter, partial [Dehalococcoidia bacterium]